MRSRENLRSFAHRDWSRFEQIETAARPKHKRARGATNLLTDADALRQHAQLLRPNWPSPEERLADLLSHVRVSEALRRVRIDDR
jgi:hypothetical protein